MATLGVQPGVEKPRRTRSVKSRVKDREPGWELFPQDVLSVGCIFKGARSQRGQPEQSEVLVPDPLEEKDKEEQREEKED